MKIYKQNLFSNRLNVLHSYCIVLVEENSRLTISDQYLLHEHNIDELLTRLRKY